MQASLINFGRIINLTIEAKNQKNLVPEFYVASAPKLRPDKALNLGGRLFEPQICHF